MGYRKSFLDYVNNEIEKVFVTTHGLKMLELGDQKIKAKEGIKEGLGKHYYENRGFEHISVDLNGLNGALVKDLSKLEDFSEYKNYFDVVTNSGTTEHVEPRNGQYEAFLNIHNSLKIGGVAIHIVPEYELHERWNTHCNHFYSKDFFDHLVENSDYEKLSTTELLGLRGYAYKKIGNGFISREEFFKEVISI